MTPPFPTEFHVVGIWTPVRQCRVPRGWASLVTGAGNGGNSTEGDCNICKMARGLQTGAACAAEPGQLERAALELLPPLSCGQCRYLSRCTQLERAAQRQLGRCRRQGDSNAASRSNVTSLGTDIPLRRKTRSTSMSPNRSSPNRSIWNARGGMGPVGPGRTTIPGIPKHQSDPGQINRHCRPLRITRASEQQHWPVQETTQDPNSKAGP